MVSRISILTCLILLFSLNGCSKEKEVKRPNPLANQVASNDSGVENRRSDYDSKSDEEDSESNAADATDNASESHADSDTVDSNTVDSKPKSHKEIIQLAENSVVYLLVRDALGEDIASGTGFLVNDQGMIATNFHVISNAVTAIAQTRAGEKMNVTEVVGYDPDNDLAILKVEELAEGLAPFELKAPHIEQGDNVTAIGHPSGFQFTATNGIVSAVRKTVELPPQFQQMVGAEDDSDWIQTSAAISGGNSGGPLLNDRGQVVGVNTWVASGQNLGFAIHVRHLLQLVKESPETGNALPIKGMGIVTDPALAKLQRDFEMEQTVLIEAMQSATTEGEVRRIQEAQQPHKDYGNRFLELADKKEGAAKLTALTLAFRTLKRSSDPKDTKAILSNLARVEEFMQLEELVELPLALSGLHQDEVLDLQKKIIQESPHSAVKGIACYALASNLKVRNNFDAQMYLAQIGDAQPEYIALLKRTTEEFGDARFRAKKLKTLFEPTLKSSRLEIGSIAPEIVGADLFGESFKLSEHRGKIVILDFWADWCPYCRQMYPHNRKLVDKYKDEPFALLGVNCDDGNRGDMAARTHKMNWRSWKDGPNGSISKDWNIEGFPTMFVIDQKGVIRTQLSATDFQTLDKIVAELLKGETNLLEGDLVKLGETWKYWENEEAPEANWNASDYSDSSWMEGNASFGFGNDASTNLKHQPIGTAQNRAYYFRKEFTIDDPSSVGETAASILFDDGVEIYLNGKEVYRTNLAADADHASFAISPRIRNGTDPNYVHISSKLLKPGKNVLAVAVHQESDWSADLRFDLSLSSKIVERCQELLKDTDESKRTPTLRMVAQLGRVCLPMVDVLKSTMTGNDDMVNLRAYIALASLAGTKADRLKPPAPKKFQSIAIRKKWSVDLNNLCWETVMHPNRSKEDYRRAVNQIMVANGLKPSGEGLNTQALALVRYGKPKDSLKALMAARKKHGKQAADFLIAAMAYEKLGKPDKAKQVLAEAKKMFAKQQDELNKDMTTLTKELESRLQ